MRLLGKNQSVRQPAELPDAFCLSMALAAMEVALYGRPTAAQMHDEPDQKENNEDSE